MSKRALLVVVGLLGASSLQAQTEVGLGASLVFPVQDFKRSTKVGVAGSGMIAYRPAGSILGARLGVAYDVLKGKETSLGKLPGRNILGVTLDLTVHPTVSDDDEPTAFSPYFFIGGGFYNQTLTDLAPGTPKLSGSHLGINLGAGTTYGLGRLKPFLEIEFQSVLLNGPNVKTLLLTTGFRYTVR